jgi:putative restriction endonuclease
MPNITLETVISNMPKNSKGGDSDQKKFLIKQTSGKGKKGNLLAFCSESNWQDAAIRAADKYFAKIGEQPPTNIAEKIGYGLIGLAGQDPKFKRRGGWGKNPYKIKEVLEVAVMAAGSVALLIRNLPDDLKEKLAQSNNEIVEKSIQKEVDILPLFEYGDAEVSTANNQELPSQADQNKENSGERLPSERKSYETNKIIRDQGLPRQVKEMYEYKCQICEVRLESGNYWYAEAAHIRALGEPHNGIDTLNNILCLCPNHHKLFDIGGFYIEDDLTIPVLKEKLYKHINHPIDLEAIRYHRAWCIER